MVKVKPVQNGRTSRMSFSRINEVIGMPNLIEIQKTLITGSWTRACAKCSTTLTRSRITPGISRWNLSITVWTSTPNIPLKNVKSVTQRMLRRFMSLRAC